MSEPASGPGGSALVITVLGCSGSYPGPGSACSGYLLEADGVKVVLDAGPGTLANLQRHAALVDVDAVVLSHAHPDHWTDLLGLDVALSYYLGGAELAVHAPGEVQELARVMCGEMKSVLDWHVIGASSTVTVGPLSFRFSRTDHQGETLAVRVEDAGSGASIGYSADTGPGWSLTQLGSAFDLALVEATIEPEHENQVQHLSGRQAGVTAKAAGARRLVLTHMAPGLDKGAAADQAAASFGGPVEVATVDQRYEVRTA